MQKKIFSRAQMAWLRPSGYAPRIMLAITTMLMLSLLACASEPLMLMPHKPAQRTNKRVAYRISPGDQLVIKFYYHPELNAEAWVRPDGFISLELIGEIRAAGLTPAALDSLIESRYDRYLKQPETLVAVTSSAAQKIYVGGEVERPQMLPLSGELSLLGAIFQSAGFKSTANLRNVMLLRNDPQRGPIIMRIDVKSSLQGKNFDANLPLQPFDVVYVPKSGIARADQFVDQFIETLLPTRAINGFAYIYFLARR